MLKKNKITTYPVFAHSPTQPNPWWALPHIHNSSVKMLCYEITNLFKTPNDLWDQKITSDYTIHQWKCYVTKLFNLFKMPKCHMRPKHYIQVRSDTMSYNEAKWKELHPSMNSGRCSIENMKWPMETICQHSTYLVVFAATGTNQARVLSISSLIWGTVNWKRSMIQIYCWNHVFQICTSYRKKS